MRALRELEADQFKALRDHEPVKAWARVAHGDVVLDRSKNPMLVQKTTFWIEIVYSAVPDLEEWARDRGCTWYSGDHCIVLVPRTDAGIYYLLEE